MSRRLELVSNMLLFPFFLLVTANFLFDSESDTEEETDLFDPLPEGRLPVIAASSDLACQHAAIEAVTSHAYLCDKETTTASVEVAVKSYDARLFGEEAQEHTDIRFRCKARYGYRHCSTDVLQLLLDGPHEMRCGVEGYYSWIRDADTPERAYAICLTLWQLEKEIVIYIEEHQVKQRAHQIGAVVNVRGMANTIASSLVGVSGCLDFRAMGSARDGR